MERFVDTHAHIYGEEYAVDVEEVIMRARNAGAEKIFLPATNLTTVEEALSVCQRFPEICYPMLGLHPEDLPSDVDAELSLMETRLQTVHPFIAVGEVGLDYYWDRSLYDEQQEAFERQIEWAARYDLPLMIHSRSAHKELVNIMERHRSQELRGVFHCFGGTLEEAQELLSFPGFALGIGGVLTYKKSPLPEVLQSVPLSRIVIETDSPYLAPVPHRGQRNESSYAIDVLKKLSYIYKVSEEEVSERTNLNVMSIFSRLNVLV